MNVNDIIKLAKYLGFDDIWKGVIYSDGRYKIYIFENVVSLFDNDKKDYVFFGHHLVKSMIKSFECEHYQYAYNRIKYEFRHKYRQLKIEELL